MSAEIVVPPSLLAVPRMVLGEHNGQLRCLLLVAQKGVSPITRNQAATLLGSGLAHVAIAWYSAAPDVAGLEDQLTEVLQVAVIEARRAVDGWLAGDGTLS